MKLSTTCGNICCVSDKKVKEFQYYPRKQVKFKEILRRKQAFKLYVNLFRKREDKQIIIVNSHAEGVKLKYEILQEVM